MTYSITVTDLRDLSAADWDALPTPDSLYTTRSWLSTGEPHSSFEPHHLVARDDSGRIAGLLPAWWYHGVRAPQYNFARLFELPDAELATTPVLVLGSRAGYYSVPLAGSTEVCTALLHRAREDSRAGAGWCLLYGEQHGVGDLIVEAFGTDAPAPLLCAADTFIDVPASGLDGYLRDLGRRRRQRVGRELRTFEASGLELRTVDPSELPNFAPLLVQNQERYGAVGDVSRAQRYLSEQLQSFANRAVVFTCSEAPQGNTIGFVYTVRHGDTLHVRTTGFDYTRLQNAFEYFNLAYYEPLRWAARNRLTRLQLGPGSYRAKLNRGAWLVPLYGWVELHDSAARTALDTAAARWRERAVEQLFGDLTAGQRAALTTEGTADATLH